MAYEFARVQAEAAEKQQRVSSDEFLSMLNIQIEGLENGGQSS